MPTAPAPARARLTVEAAAADTGAVAAHLTGTFRASQPTGATVWTSLGTPREELRLQFTLPTGQSFRWREAGPQTYIGIIGQRMVSCCTPC